MTSLKFHNIFTAAENYDVLLLDVWGVITEGNIIYPGVVDVINKLSELKQVYFVSNSPRPIRMLYEMINSWGIDTSIDRVMCSGEIARKLLSTINNLVIYHLGRDRNHDILLNINHTLTNDISKANAFLLTLFRDEGENLEEFDDILKQIAELNIPIICANPDVIVPNKGVTRYAPGYFANKIEAYGGKVTYTGKPYLKIYEMVLNKISSVPLDRILMIGDTFETDILGAKNAGIASALVLTGNAYELHKNYLRLDEKLEQITKYASKMNIMPNFVTTLADI